MPITPPFLSRAYKCVRTCGSARSTVVYAASIVSPIHPPPAACLYGTLLLLLFRTNVLIHLRLPLPLLFTFISRGIFSFSIYPSYASCTKGCRLSTSDLQLYFPRRRRQKQQKSLLAFPPHFRHVSVGRTVHILDA